MDSVFAQSAELEYIVVDGGSTDETIPIIKSFGSRVRYISEPDRGIYDAMNKGIALATGKGLLFLNAGDYFNGDVLMDPMPVPCFLPVYYTDPLGRYRKISIKRASRGIPNCHQGIVFERVIPPVLYNLDYLVASDLDFFLRNGLDENLPMLECTGHVVYDNAGFSKENVSLRDMEIGQIVGNYFGARAAFRFRSIAFMKRLMAALILRPRQGIR